MKRNLYSINSETVIKKQGMAKLLFKLTLVREKIAGVDVKSGISGI
jgi:hypothetical protein